MAKIVRGKADPEARAFKDALDAYERDHRGSKADLYRQNNASVRIRVIDRKFAGVAKSRRHASVWKFLAARVPEDALSDVSILLTLAPAELESNMMNIEFDHPEPSMRLK